MKRRLYSGLLLAIASVIVNVAVAWASALQVRLCGAPDVGRHVWQTDKAVYSVRHLRKLTAEQVVVGAVAIVDKGGQTTPALDPAMLFLDVAPEFTLGEMEPRPRLPAWADLGGWLERLRLKGLPRSGSPDFRIREARGWPFRSMVCVLEPGAGTGDWRIVGTSAIPARRWADPCAPYVSDQRALPLRPIWSGLIINSIVYILIVALAWTVACAVVGMGRRRRERCPVCGCSVGGETTCPECGQLLSGPRG